MKTPLTFVISETYETWDEEAVEIGETDDKGFNFEDEEYELDDLQDYIEKEGFTNASEVPVTNTGVWLSTDSEEDYQTGERTTKSIHCSKVLDADGKELTPAQQGKVWRNLVRQVVGEKLEHNSDYGL